MIILLFDLQATRGQLTKFPPWSQELCNLITFLSKFPYTIHETLCSLLQFLNCPLVKLLTRHFPSYLLLSSALKSSIFQSNACVAAMVIIFLILLEVEFKFMVTYLHSCYFLLFSPRINILFGLILTLLFVILFIIF